MLGIQTWGRRMVDPLDLTEHGFQQQKSTSEGGSPGLVVMGDSSCSRVRGFKSLGRILDGHFSHWFVVKIVLFN